MAKTANTYVTTDAKLNREELSSVVNRITPEDTPVYSMAGKASCRTTHPEWSTDELAAPAANAQPEGDEYSFAMTTAPKRLKNHTQIFSKSFIISGTQEAIAEKGANAARVEASKYQRAKKGVELRKDVEFAILSATASSAADPRKMGGLPTWIETNATRGSRGANGGYKQATGLTTAPNAGTKRAFTKALLDETMQKVYKSGGNVRKVVLSPYCKSVFTSFMSSPNVAQFRKEAKGAHNAIVATADMYIGDFGTVGMVPNRVMAGNAALASNIFLISPDMLDFAWLRPIMDAENVPQGSDAKRGVILGEGTICVKNEKGIGVIADVFGLTSTT